MQTGLTHGSSRTQSVVELSPDTPVILQAEDLSGNIVDVGSVTLRDLSFANVKMSEGEALFDESLDDFMVDDTTFAALELPMGVNAGEPAERVEPEMRASLSLEEENREVNAFIKEQLTKSTMRKTQQTVARFQKWLIERHEDTRPMEKIPPSELDILMGSFLMTAKIEKGNRAGEPYEPETLTSMHRAFDRHLRAENYQVSIMKDPAFNTSRAVLSSKKKSLKKMGKGNKPNKAEPLSDEAIDLLWKKGFLGCHAPTSLIHTVFVYFVMNFGMRPNHGSHQLRWGDVTLHEEQQPDGSVVRYLEWNERLTKTRAGQLEDGVRAFAPKLYEIKGERCPVAAYEAYAARRPAKCMSPESPFYLGINHQASLSSPTWYINMQMGLNTIIPIMSTMAQKAGLPGRITNYSLRKTMLTTLLQQNVPPNMIMQVSGHKNVESVNHYAVASRAQQQAMSNIICGVSRPANEVKSSHPQLSAARNNPALESGPSCTATSMDDGDEDVGTAPAPAPVAPLANTDRPKYSEKCDFTGAVVARSNMSEETVLHRRLQQLENRDRSRDRHDGTPDNLLQGILSGAHVQGNVSISIQYSNATNMPTVTMSPKLPNQPALQQ